MTIKIGQFRIPVIASLIVIIGLSILLSLGQWQLTRAEEKEAIINQINERQTMQPINLIQLDKQTAKNYFHLRFKGEYDNKHYLLLDNRILKGRPGFEVIQPIQDGSRTILVNRGWIPLPRDRRQLPAIPLIEGIQAITGIVYEPTEAIVLKEDQLNAQQWPILIQSLDMDKLTSLYKQVNKHIEPWVLRQDADNEVFYQREWQYHNMPPERHISYAVTWFGLAFALIIIYIAVLTRGKEK